MSATWGDNVKLTIFGESHGNAIGGVLDGLPPGISLDMDRIQFQMRRRAPGHSQTSTPRKEDDIPEVLSGIFHSKTTGAPLAFMIRNHNTKSKDYEELRTKMRPSHADYGGWVKFKGFNDYRGGGHFSGRITAPLVFAGAVCEQVLQDRGIYVGSFITALGGVACDKPELPLSKEYAEQLKKETLPIFNENQKHEVLQRIESVKNEGNSVGGIIECHIHGVPAGLGSPFFDSFESRLSHLLFSIPAVKGVEFGDGFKIAAMTGKEANDPMKIQDGRIKTVTNHNGGIVGGITNGMPVVFRVAVKPTPSIFASQQTIDVLKKENTTLTLTGRHDPVIVPRAIPVVEACALLCTLDALKEENI